MGVVEPGDRRCIFPRLWFAPRGSPPLPHMVSAKSTHDSRCASTERSSSRRPLTIFTITSSRKPGYITAIEWISDTSCNTQTDFNLAFSAQSSHKSQDMNMSFTPPSRIFLNSTVLHHKLCIDHSRHGSRDEFFSITKDSDREMITMDKFIVQLFHWLYYFPPPSNIPFASSCPYYPSPEPKSRDRKEKKFQR